MKKPSMADGAPKQSGESGQVALLREIGCSDEVGHLKAYPQAFQALRKKIGLMPQCRENAARGRLKAFLNRRRASARKYLFRACPPNPACRTQKIKCDYPKGPRL